MVNSIPMVQTWKSVEEFLYDTFKKEFRVWSIELRKEKNIIAIKQKYNKPFVDYRNSGTDFHVC